MSTTVESAPGATVSREPTGTDQPTTIRVPGGIPGFPRQQDWQLLLDAEIEPLMWFSAVGEHELKFLVLDPRIVSPSYEPKLGPAALDAVGAKPEDPLVVLGIVHLDADGSASINLRAPLVICPRTMRGAQVILDRSDFSMKHPIEVGG